MTSAHHIPDPAKHLLPCLAERVRSLRKARGMPRRELSARSGVSPRYLAQLEAGSGNISVVLLARVAAALDVQMEDLLAEADPLNDDATRVAALFAKASPAVKGRVRALLAPQSPAALRARRICLVGLRGAGKSTLGRLAADKLRMPFLELNECIERKAGMPLSEVMALYGEDGYRTMEAEALEDVIAEYDRLILAVAGGIVADDRTFAQVLERFHTIWVRTSPAEHMTRVRAQGDLRPMEGHPAAMDALKTLLTARAPLYRKAQAQLDTSGKPLGSSLNELLAIIAKRKFLDDRVA